MKPPREPFLSEQKFPWAAMAIVLAAVSSALHGEDLLIEGFEDLPAVSVSGGKAVPVAGGQGVTQGKQAIQVPPGTTVRVKLAGEDCRKMGWLRIDTMTVQPLPAAVRVLFEGDQFWLSRNGCLQPGQDVLAIPLTTVSSARAEGWPDGEIRFSLTNCGEQPLILDNVRLCPAAAAPADSLLLDFGPEANHSWPGFEHAGMDHQRLSWTGERAGGAWNYGYPDPMTGDFIGMPPGDRSADSVRVTTPSGANFWGALWVTHYGDNQLQPPECLLKIDGKTVLHKMVPASRYATSDCLLEGQGGEWTPSWFDRTYAGRFCDVIKFSASDGSFRLDLGNCQLAALAIAPASQHAAMAAYIDEVEKDISRYRRQFVLGQRLETVCNLPPTEAERQAGLMVFQPKADDWFSPRYRPAETERVTAVKLFARPGGSAYAVLAAVPLKSSAVGATVGSFAGGAPGRRTSARVDSSTFFFDSVPRVLDAHVEFQPWLMARKSEMVRERGVAFLLLRLDVGLTVSPGVYEGTVTFLFGTAKRELPVSMEVVALPALPPSAATLGAFETFDAGSFFDDQVAGIAPPQRNLLTAKLRQAILGEGLNAMRLNGPWVGAAGHVRMDRFAEEVAGYPVRQASGKTLVDVRSSLWDLKANMVEPGSQKFRTAISALVEQAKEAGARARLGDYCFLIGGAGNPEDFRATSRAASVFASCGAVPAVETWGWALHNDRVFRDDLLKSIGILVVAPEGGNLAESVPAFLKLSAGRCVYIRTGRPDRYATGFFAAGLGADGAYIDGMRMQGSLYNGFHLNGRGVIVPQPGGKTANTLALAALWMGREDLMLYKAAETLSEQAARQNVDASALTAVLEDIRRTVAKHSSLWFQDDLLRTNRATPTQLEAWRTAIFQAVSALPQKLKKQ